ncbi:MAG: cupin domain-containing protein [Vulcanimicrobiota bacterium]
MEKARLLIDMLGLEPLPGEGGYYRETYRSSEVLNPGALPSRYDRNKNFSTAIYYLLTPNTRSLLHKLPTDEVYHFYLGDPVLMLNLFPNGTIRKIVLGNDVFKGQLCQYMVPAQTFQGSLLVEGGNFALMGTTMAPGFDFSDFIPGNRKRLADAYPDEFELINLLTGQE